MEQVAQRSCGWPITGSAEGRVEWGFEQIDRDREKCPKGNVLDDF